MLLKQVGLYTLFYLVIALSCLIFFSVASHFHLTLGHDFMAVGDWIADYVWEVIFLSKFFAPFFLFAVLNVQSDNKNILKTFLLNFEKGHSKDIYVVIVFFFLSIILISNPIIKNSDHFSFFPLMISFVGTYVFYMTDILVIGYIYTIYSKNRRYHYGMMLTFSFLFYIFSKGAFFFAGNLDITAFFNMFMLLFLFQWGEKNWTAPSKFCLLCLCPFSSFFGTDPMWSSRHSLFQFSTPLGPLSYAAMILLCLIYLYRKDKNRSFSI